jgi:general secretion pathway protein A
MHSQFFQFFGLRENAFSMNPDPSYLFVNRRTQSVLDELANAIQARKTLLLLTGEVGTGKTTLINCLMDWLNQQRTPTAFIFNPRLEPNELFELMLASFEGFSAPRQGGTARQRLNQWLVEQNRLRKRPVLILDEAQGLPNHVLEEVRLLLNQETPGEKRLQVLLCGQPELEEKLRRPEMRQIRQRIEVRCQTIPLSRDETRSYMQMRLNTAGALGASIFLPDAMDAVHFYARGIPRVTNLLSEQSMLKACSQQIKTIPGEIVDEVARQLQFDELRPVAGPGHVLAEVEEAFSAATEPAQREPADSAPLISASVSAEAADFVATVSPKHPSPEMQFFMESLRLNAQNSEDSPTPYAVAKKRAEIDKPAAPHPIAINSKTRAKTTRANGQSRSSAELMRQSAVLGKELWVSVSSAVASSIQEGQQKFSSLAKSRGWEGEIRALLNWLQQPMSTATIKAHRKADS